MKRLLAIVLLIGAGYTLTLGYLGRFEWTLEFMWLATGALLLGLAAGVSLARREPHNAVYILLVTGVLIALLYTDSLSLLEVGWDPSYRSAIGGGLATGMLAGGML